MFYKKRIEALERRVTALEGRAEALVENAKAQNHEIELLLAKLAGAEKKEAEPTRMPRRYRRRKNGKETPTTE